MSVKEDLYLQKRKADTCSSYHLPKKLTRKRRERMFKTHVEKMERQWKALSPRVYSPNNRSKYQHLFLKHKESQPGRHWPRWLVLQEQTGLQAHIDPTWPWHQNLCKQQGTKEKGPEIKSLTLNL